MVAPPPPATDCTIAPCEPMPAVDTALPASSVRRAGPPEPLVPSEPWRSRRAPSMPAAPPPPPTDCTSSPRLRGPSVATSNTPCATAGPPSPPRPPSPPAMKSRCAPRNSALKSSAKTWRSSGSRVSSPTSAAVSGAVPMPPMPPPPPMDCTLSPKALKPWVRMRFPATPLASARAALAPAPPAPLEPMPSRTTAAGRALFASP